MKQSTFHVAKMDCPAEEQLIRLKLLGKKEVQKIEASVSKREIIVFHHGNEQEIFHALEDLNLNSKLVESTEVKENLVINSEPSNEKRLLWMVLAINLIFFIIEFSCGVLYRSMGLIGDGLDMFADSLVYGLAIWAVGAAQGKKKRVATWAGILQFSLAAFGMVEVVRRFIAVEENPDYYVMAMVSGLALLGNASCLFILQKSGSTEPHIQASKIFTSSDVLANLGVIVAAGLVFLSGSNVPDLVVGSIIFSIVAWGAVRILRLS